MRKNKFMTIMFSVISISLLVAQEFDINLYQKTTLKNDSQWRVITTTEYHKADVVFVETRRNDLRIGTGNVYYGFIELFGNIEKEDYGVVGPIGLPLSEIGQFVTIYYRTLPKKWEDNGVYIDQIDKIVFPAESYNFNATHRIISRTDVISESHTKKILFSLDAGVEVEALENIDNRIYAPIITTNGFGGWVESRCLEPILLKK